MIKGMKLKNLNNKSDLKKILWMHIFIFSMVHFSISQDLHFSQFYNSPLTANPANTGFMPDADYRIGGNYRKQFATVPVPYKTMSAFGDVQVARDKFYNGWFGAGFVFLGDEAGTGSLQSNKLYASVAYHQVVTENSVLSVGFQGGLVRKNIDISKLTFDNQWNGKFFNVQGPSGENFARTDISYLDLNAGINYSAFPTEESYLNFGLAVQHFNKPKETFFNNVTSTGAPFDNKLSRRFTAFFNGSFKLNDRVIVNPQGYVTHMDNVTQVNMGGNLLYNLSGEEGGQSLLIAGAYYRVKDAIIPMLGLKHKSITATFTYDATASKLTPFNSMRGGSEISIIHTGIINQRAPKNMRCQMPAF
jgi:type IX secretion system PorP/SprF family membrane protein